MIFLKLTPMVLTFKRTRLESKHKQGGRKIEGLSLLIKPVWNGGYYFNRKVKYERERVVSSKPSAKSAIQIISTHIPRKSRSGDRSYKKKGLGSKS